jgi:modulator of FtsH protease
VQQLIQKDDAERPLEEQVCSVRTVDATGVAVSHDGEVMYDYSSAPRYAASPADSAVTERPAVLGTVLALLGFASIFTACGAFLAPLLGPSALIISVVGSLGTLLALFVVRERSPLNLILLYAFATFEGLALGLILESYLTSGMGSVVLNAALTTAAVTLGAGAYGYTTRRDFSGAGAILTVGLIGVIVASVIGIFIQQPLLYIAISAVSAVLFTGFLVYDLNRVAQSRGATQGEAILLAVSVYLDVFNVFLALLQMIEREGSDLESANIPGRCGRGTRHRWPGRLFHGGVERDESC